MTLREDTRNKLHFLYRGDRLSCYVSVKRFPIKVVRRQQNLKLRRKRKIVPALASNEGVTCHSREHMLELKRLK